MKETEFTIWDVQHGSAAYIKSPNDKHIIVDAGLGSYANGDSFSPLCHLWKNCGVKQLDYAILTHPHKDHIEDIDWLAYLNPKVLARPKHLTQFDIITFQTRESDIPIYNKYITLDNKYYASVETCNDPTNVNSYDGLQIENFVATKCSKSNLNNHSMISVFSYAGFKVIITGDNEEASYNELADNTRFTSLVKNSDVLVASHHGRKSGFHEGFVKYVNPQITIISDNSKAETSAASDYGRISRGFTVFSRKNLLSLQKRNIISTYNDGVIHMKIGYYGFESYMGIWVD